MRETGRFDGEQGDLVRPYVAGLARQLAQRVVADDHVGLEAADMGDHLPDGLVEGRVEQPESCGSRLRVAGVAKAQQTGSARAENGERVGELGGPGR
ncbi:hypothetical protein [Streptomyces sp. NPDC001594]|uniref:hypothetical protein n=1 Tax=Streptomyces sp. NPDC001594 TaxID=3364590 RepID=UPI00369D15E5